MVPAGPGSLVAAVEHDLDGRGPGAIERAGDPLPRLGADERTHVGALVAARTDP